jgi:hypothetical protein
MKYLQFIFIFCLAQNILLAQANPKQTISSTIKKVTLFTTGAQVHRSQKQQAASNQYHDSRPISDFDD